MRARNHPRKLLVEGETDQSVIPYLMEANGVTWPDPPNSPVCIKKYGGVDEILKPGVIEGEVKASGLEALGIVVDANGDAVARWDQLRTSCSSEFAELPDQIPAEGLEVVHSYGSPRVGIWIMPDNRLTGMLEDFLVQLIPPEQPSNLYGLARNCVAESKRRGAPFRDVHERKAEIYTWLAWQDEPGTRLHEAVKHRFLDPASPLSRPSSTGFGDSLACKVLGRITGRHRATELRQFVAQIDRAPPPELALQLIVDNSSTHITEAIQDFQAVHPRFYLHFTPTSASWLNAVETWFGHLERAENLLVALRRQRHPDRLRSEPRLHLPPSGRYRGRPVEDARIADDPHEAHRNSSRSARASTSATSSRPPIMHRPRSTAGVL